MPLNPFNIFASFLRQTFASSSGLRSPSARHVSYLGQGLHAQGASISAPTKISALEHPHTTIMLTRLGSSKGIVRPVPWLGSLPNNHYLFEWVVPSLPTMERTRTRAQIPLPIFAPRHFPPALDNFTYWSMRPRYDANWYVHQRSHVVRSSMLWEDVIASFQPGDTTL